MYWVQSRGIELSLALHQLDELVETYIAVPVQIGLLQDLIQVFFAYVLSQFPQTITQLLLCDEAIAVFVKNLKHLLEICRLILFSDLTALHRLYLAMKLRNSSSSMVPFPSVSIFLMMSSTSSLEELKSNCFMMAWSSWVGDGIRLQ